MGRRFGGHAISAICDTHAHVRRGLVHRRVRPRAAFGGTRNPPARPVVAALALAALASAAAWFCLVARAMAGGDFDSDIAADVAFATAFGAAWLAHMAALLAARRARAEIVALVSGVALASLALTGHAAMRGGALGAIMRCISSSPRAGSAACRRSCFACAFIPRRRRAATRSPRSRSCRSPERWTRR